MRGDAGRPGLGDFLDQDVYPKLSVEDVFTSPAHAWRERGKTWKGGCPWHESKSGSSFTVDEDSLRWWCGGCQIGGSPTQYLHGLKTGSPSTPNGDDFVEIARELARMSGVPFPSRELTEEEKARGRAREARRSVLDVVISHAAEVLWSPAGEAARAYLTKERKFTEEDLRTLHVGFYDSVAGFRSVLDKAGLDPKDANVDPDQKGSSVLREELEGFAVFPWWDERGRPLTLYGRWKEKTPPLQKDHPGYRWKRDKAREEWEARKATGAAVSPWEEPMVPKTTALLGEGTKGSPLYFNRARAAGVQELVLVEGVIDAALLQVRGDARVVASVAAVVSKLQVEALVRNRVKAVYICGDPDPGGDAGTLSNIKALEAAGISTFVMDRLPDGLDPDEFLLRDGMDAWKDRVSRAVPGSVFKATHALDGVTPTSPTKEKREAVAKVLTIMEDLHGERAALDQEDILRDLVDRTGYSSDALAVEVEEHTKKRKKEKADAAIRATVETARKELERTDGEAADPLALARDLEKKLSTLRSVTTEEPPVFSVERLWRETEKAPVGRKSGWDKLDALDVRFHAGELAYLMARTGHGKTSVLVGLLWNWLRASDPDETLVLYSHEEAEVRIFHRLLSLFSTKDTGAGTSGWTRPEIRGFAVDPASRPAWPIGTLLSDAKKKLAALESRLLVVHRPSWTADDIAAHALSLVERGRRVGGVLVDYLQRIPTGEKADRRDIEISAVARRLKALSEEVDAPVVLGAQVNREAIPKDFSKSISEAETYQDATSTIRTARPALHHLREGGSEQEADLILGLLNYAADYAADATDKTVPLVTLLEVGTLKTREGEPGKWVGLAFEGRYGLIRETTADEDEDLRVEAAPSKLEYFKEREAGLSKRSEALTERQRSKETAARLKLDAEREKTERERERTEREKLKAAGKPPKKTTETTEPEGE